LKPVFQGGQRDIAGIGEVGEPQVRMLLGKIEDEVTIPVAVSPAGIGAGDTAGMVVGKSEEGLGDGQQAWVARLDGDRLRPARRLEKYRKKSLNGGLYLVGRGATCTRGDQDLLGRWRLEPVGLEEGNRRKKKTGGGAGGEVIG
jgi:hypothetical protein